jgi:hypothetical protein
MNTTLTSSRQTRSTRTFTPRRSLALGVSGLLVLAACGSDDSDSAAPVEPADAVSAETTPGTTPVDPETPVDSEPVATEAPADTEPKTTDAVEPEPVVTLAFDGLPALGEEAVYEGWAIVDEAPISTGRFLIDEAGLVIDEAGDPIDHFGVDATGAAAFVLTIEPKVDDDPAPSDTHLLAGDIVDGVANLSIGHPAALGTDFADVAGSVEVAVPTARGLAGAETAGAWFFSGGSGSLTLPVLPAGWTYEGWVVFDGQPVSTGRFLDPNTADDFNGFSGDGGSPATPGEDFIRNAPEGLEFPRSVAGTTAVISVEPAPDDSAAPFTLKPLVGPIADDATPLSEHDLGANFDGVPTGTATVHSI